MLAVTTLLAFLAALTATLLVAEVQAACICPEQCTCNLLEGDIDCSGHGLQTIPVGINCAWPNIIKLQLQQNQISHVQEYAFSLLGKLQRLYLFDNVIETIDRNAFFNLTQLQYLYLDNNRISDLPDGLFHHVTALNTLLLYSNRLSYLPVNIFSSLRQLLRLALHRNLFTILDARSFNGLVSLQQLYLSENQIIGLSNAPFTFLNELKSLFLGNNNLTRLTRFDFIGVNRLEILELHNNIISFIDDDTFLLHPEIRELYLSNNLVSRVTRLTFAGILNLEKLHLSNNHITSVSEGAFFRNRDLREIILSGNGLTELHQNILAGLQSLETLAVTDNKLTFLVTDNFKHVPLLHVLDLNSNNISCIEPDTFKGVPALLYLNLGRNALSYLPENTFQNTPDLIYLLLHHNNLCFIGTPVFRNLHRLIQLSLQYNCISHMIEGALEGTDRVFYLQWNVEFNFTVENRLVCDCSSRWLYRYIQQRGHTVQATIYCAGPPALRNREIKTLADTDFACDELTGNSLQVHAGPSCDNHVVNKGGCLRLMCTSTPHSHTKWSRVDGKPMLLAPHVCQSFSSCVPDMGDSELVVADTSEEEVGTYICTATLMNVTTAVACKVSLGEPPYVLSRPVDQYLAWPGETAFFRVRVSGQPRPSVEWYHDTLLGYTEPIEEDRRHLISVSGSLIVMDTKLEDEGMYHAIISNGAGTETVVATLEFFFPSPCREKCYNGGTCYQTSYCYCKPNFVGRYCEIYEGPPSEAPTCPPNVTDCYEEDDDDESGYYDDMSGYSDDMSGYSDDMSGYYDDGAGYYDDFSGDYNVSGNRSGYYNDGSGYYDDDSGYYDGNISNESGSDYRPGNESTDDDRPVNYDDESVNYDDNEPVNYENDSVNYDDNGSVNYDNNSVNYDDNGSVNDEAEPGDIVINTFADDDDGSGNNDESVNDEAEPGDIVINTFADDDDGSGNNDESVNYDKRSVNSVNRSVNYDNKDHDTSKEKQNLHLSKTSDDVTMSPWQLEGERFQALLWKMTARERRFDRKLKKARQRKASEMEIEDMLREQDFLLQQWEEREKKRNNEKRFDHNQRESWDLKDLEMEIEREVQAMMMDQHRVRQRRKHKKHSEFYNSQLNSKHKLQREENQDWRDYNLLMELGLAVEWNGDHYPIEKRDEDIDNAPVVNGLKLLCANHLKIKNTIKPTDLDIHTD